MVVCTVCNEERVREFLCKPRDERATIRAEIGSIHSHESFQVLGVYRSYAGVARLRLRHSVPPNYLVLRLESEPFVEPDCVQVGVQPYGPHADFLEVPEGGLHHLLANALPAKIRRHDDGSQKREGAVRRRVQDPDYTSAALCGSAPHTLSVQPPPDGSAALT